MFDNMQGYYGAKMVWFVGSIRAVYPDHVKVRVFGIHGMEDITKISDGDLPPAVVLYPTTGGQASSGAYQHNLSEGSWVVGFFADGEHCQQPIIIGVIGEGLYTGSMYASSSEFPTSSPTPGNPDIDTGTTINIPGGSNIEKAYNYVRMKIESANLSQDPHMHSSALIGVLMLETSGIDPTVEGGYKGRAWGICQWLGDRRTELLRRYGPTKDLGQQLDFMWWELNNTEKSAKRAWLSGNNLPDAVAGFCAFERAEEWQNGRVNRQHPNFEKRLKYAYQVYNSIQYNKNFGPPTRNQAL